jgi:hypothetical protein
VRDAIAVSPAGACSALAQHDFARGAAPAGKPEYNPNQGYNSGVGFCPLLNVKKKMGKKICFGF